MPSSPALRSSRARRAGARLAVSVLAAAILVATPLAASASPVPAAADSADPSWDVATVDGDQGAGRADYDYSAEAGERIDDAVLVSNPGDAPLELALYAADGFTTKAGQFDLRTRDADATSVGAWLTLTADSVTLQPGESAEVPFSVVVPDDAKGEYVGGIVTSIPGTDAGAERRAALRVRLHVGSSFEPGLAVEDVRVDDAGGFFGGSDATVTYTVRNTGDVVLAAEQSVALTGPFGLAPAEASGHQSTPQLLPGESWTVTVPVTGVTPLVALTATVTAVPLFTDAAGSTGPLAAVDGGGLGWAIPWGPVLGILIVLALGVFLLVRFARRPRPAQPADAAADAAPTAEEREPELAAVGG